MKEKIFINARIIDPSQKIDETGSLILDKNGKVKAIGKKVKKSDAESSAEIFDIKGNVLIPGIVDMKAFVGEPGYEYKENFSDISSVKLSDLPKDLQGNFSPEELLGYLVPILEDLDSIFTVEDLDACPLFTHFGKVKGDKVVYMD